MSGAVFYAKLCAVRNIFDQYTQPENRLTHSLVMALYEDSGLLKAFLTAFGPKNAPPIKGLKIIEQGLPGRMEEDENEAMRRGLPDALIFNKDGWALVIESKISATLTKDQLQRHSRTVTKCGFDKIYGLTITTDTPGFEHPGWKAVTWKDVYAWANQQKASSSWARRMVEYFNVAEGKMANSGYLTEGTITEFSGISFDPYSYLEGKRLLRLLMKKIRQDKNFIKTMGLVGDEERHAISNQTVLWDFLKFKPRDGKVKNFIHYPHCTVGIGETYCEAHITFPSAIDATLRKRLCGDSLEDFIASLSQANDSIKKELKGVSGYKPIIRVMQRRYPSQKSIPIMDGKMEFDLRVVFGDAKPEKGPAIKRQIEWVSAVYELLQNKKSNIQLQIGVMFPYDDCAALKSRDADKLFVGSFRALKGFVDSVI